MTSISIGKGDIVITHKTANCVLSTALIERLCNSLIAMWLKIDMCMFLNENHDVSRGVPPTLEGGAGEEGGGKGGGGQGG